MGNYLRVSLWCFLVAIFFAVFYSSSWCSIFGMPFFCVFMCFLWCFVVLVNFLCNIFSMVLLCGGVAVMKHAVVFKTGAE